MTQSALKPEITRFARNIVLGALAAEHAATR